MSRIDGERIENTAGKRSALSRFLASVAQRVTAWTGSNWGFSTALAVVIIWAVAGPLFHYSDTWQLTINTGSTIVTFLMVFLIQRTQNKDGLAIQLKLNELVAAVEGASNRLIDIEDLSEEELEALRTHFRTLVKMARDEENITRSHSVEEAEARHIYKRERRRRPRQERSPG
jgi:low affinity Fe/Cu permease